MKRRGSPLSRRLMITFFVVTLVPMLGWSVVVDLSEKIWQHADALPAPALAEVKHAFAEAKQRLILVLGGSLTVFALGMIYLRRVLVRPLEDLARHSARAAEEWQRPRECERDDEIGALARALDHSVQELQGRAERAWLLAADLSHELRTPLSAIVGAAEIISQEAPSEQERSLFAQNILQQSRRLERLVAGILDLERQGLAPPAASQPEDIVVSLRRVHNALIPLLRRKALSVDLDIPASIPTVPVDPDRHERLVYALLENAIKYSPPGGKILVSVRASQDFLRVSIDDEGPGIPPNQQRAVFQRYTRGKESTSARGNGLGLAIADLLVRSWNGSVEARTSPLGGACFEYTVPLIPKQK